jgi:hypothetical protein
VRLYETELDPTRKVGRKQSNGEKLGRKDDQRAGPEGDIQIAGN